MEHCEDRRLLAVAAGDTYYIAANETLAVGGDGTWANDSYNVEWHDSYWEPHYQWIAEHWEQPVLQEGTWEDPAWYWYDENDESQGGYWNPPEPVCHACIWSPPEPVWHDGEWEGQEVITATYHASDSIVSYPAHGTLTLHGWGNFTYTPSATFAGSDTFTYELTDNNGSSTATVTIIGNSEPIAFSDSYVVAKDSSLTISSASLLANDFDADGDSLTASQASRNTAHGNFVSNGDGSFTYTPDMGYSGWDSFDYQAYDGYEYSNLGIIWINVNASIEMDANFEVQEGGSLSVIVWLSHPTDHDVSATLVIQSLDGPSALARWAETQIGVVIPAGQDYANVSLSTVDDQLLNGIGQFTVSLVNPAGAELGLQSSSPISLFDDEHSVALVWDSLSEVETSFSGTLPGIVSVDGSVVATGTDFFGHPFTARISIAQITGVQTIDLTIDGLEPQYGHWTGTSESGPNPETPYRFPMRPDAASSGIGEWVVALAQKPPQRQCGDGGASSVLTRNDFGGRIKKPMGYHQQWNRFRLAEPARSCGVIVIQKIIVHLTVTTSPPLPALPGEVVIVNPATNEGTKSFPSVSYYEIIGRIPAGQRVLQGVVDNWIMPVADQPTNGPIVNNLVMSQDGFAVAYEDDAAAQAAVAGWVVHQQDVIATIGDRELTITSGTFPSSTQLDATGLTVFADEDAWHDLRYEFNRRPLRQRLTVDGQDKRRQ